MELRQLEYFSVLAEELHFGRAAERLHIVQSAVTQQIQRLERSLGVELFDRSRRAVRLTAAGERFLPEARAALAAVDRAARAARGADGPEVVIGSSQGLGRRLDDVLARVAAAGAVPRLEQLPVEQRLRAVRTGRLDAAFVRAAAEQDGVRLVPLWRDALLVVLPEGHDAGQGADAGVDLARLAHLPLRLAPRERNPPFVDLVRAACRAAGFEPVPGAPFTSLQDTLAQLAVGPPSWTVLDSPAAVPEGARLVVVPVSPPVEVVVSLAVAEPPSEGGRVVLEAGRDVVSRT